MFVVDANDPSIASNVYDYEPASLVVHVAAFAASIARISQIDYILCCSLVHLARITSHPSAAGMQSPRYFPFVRLHLT